jgi:hypothetical protein
MEHINVRVVDTGAFLHLKLNIILAAAGLHFKNPYRGRLRSLPNKVLV